MACTGTDHMFGHAVLHTHAHAHAHTHLHAVVSGMQALRAQRLASGCRYGNQAARRRLVENVECAASESRLSTLRGSTHAIAQKPHAKWKTCHAHSCAWAWACHLQISIVAMCLETQLDVTRPKATATREFVNILMKTEAHSATRPREPAPWPRANRHSSLAHCCRCVASMHTRHHCRRDASSHTRHHRCCVARAAALVPVGPKAPFFGPSGSLLAGYVWWGVVLGAPLH